MAQQFQYLFTPLKVGHVTLKNRIVMTAHGTNFYEWHLGEYMQVSERAVYYFAERAKGGVGLMLLGTTSVHPSGGVVRPAMYRDDAVPALKKIADAIHQHGGRFLVQLNNVVRGRPSGGDDGYPQWAPSPIPHLAPSYYGAPNTGEIPKEMDEEDIQEFIQGFIKSSRNVKESGSDGIEFHAAHDSHINMFLSPAFNKRTDKYGGSHDNRMRLLLECIDAVRKECGRDFIVGVKMNADEMFAGGITLELATETARKLDATGKVDYLCISHSGMQIAPMGIPHGFLVPYAAAVKQVVEKTPVMAVGRIVDPVEAEKVLADGHADLVAMTRATIADPELPNKAREGKLDEVRLCVGAQSCFERHDAFYFISCLQNPAAGREKEWGIGTMRPATRKKKVLVAGGGPAGLEVARVAALRGHEVILCEKDNQLGGQVNLARKAPLREEFGGITDHLGKQVAKLGVQIKLSTVVTPETVKALNPDAVVVATGSTPRRYNWYAPRLDLPGIPGADQSNVFTVWDVLNGALERRKKVVIIGEAGYYQDGDAMSYLLERGHVVDAITHFTTFAPVTGVGRGPLYLRNLRGKPITFYRLSRVNRILEDSVEVQDLETGKETVVHNVDAVVLSLGNMVNDGLYHALKGKVNELYRIGDCLAPRKAEHAIFEGHKVGRQL